MKEKGWRSLVQRHPVGSVLGMLIAGYWIGQKFSSSADSKITSEIRKDVGQIPDAQGSLSSGDNRVSLEARESINPVHDVQISTLIKDIFIKKTGELLADALARKTSEFLADTLIKKMREFAKEPDKPINS